MVQEVRSILFDAEECQAAITQLLMMKVCALQAHQVVRVELSGPKITARVTVRLAKVTTEHTMDMADLMSAVLLFCRKARIPLSTRSQKRLSLISGRLALTTSINLRSACSTTGDGTIFHAVAGPDLALMHIL